MSCPHGRYSNPNTCSQCLGIHAKKYRVVDGIIEIDGKPSGTVAEINRARYREETENSLPTKRRACGKCRKPGHRVDTCPEIAPDDESIN